MRTLEVGTTGNRERAAMQSLDGQLRSAARSVIGGRCWVIAVVLSAALLGLVNRASAQCDKCPGETGFNMDEFCVGGECGGLSGFLDLIVECYCDVPAATCDVPPEVIAAASEYWWDHCYGAECEPNVECPPHPDRPTPCELAAWYCSKFAAVCSDPDKKCAVYKAFGCASDCGPPNGGGGPIIDDPWYPPGDPVGPWDLGDPFGDPNGGAPSDGNVNLATGTFTSTEIDLNFPSPGFSWTIARANTRSRPNTSGDYVLPVSDTSQGNNWYQLSQPILTVNETLGIITIQYQSDGYLQFSMADNSGEVYVGIGKTKGGIVSDTTTTPDVLRYFNTRGTEVVFFDPRDTSNVGNAGGRLWYIKDAAGHQAWVKHPSNASTATGGYNASKNILMAVDSGQRRYTYEYSSSTINGAERLLRVIVARKSSGNWEDNTFSGVVEVGRVEYEYYTSDETDRGKTGDLKSVRVDLPMTVPTLVSSRTRYFRYYTASTGGAIPSMLKMVVGAEGVRRFDWQDQNFDGDHLTASDADLKAYSEIFLKYNALNDIRINEYFSHGQCGCGSQGNGLNTLTYESNSVFTPDFGYDQEWKSRTIVARPDGTYVTHYTDELYQPFAEVRTSAAPGTSGVSVWATTYARDGAMAWTTQEYTPAVITGYNHTSGAFTASSTAGLAFEYEYYDGGPLVGTVYTKKWKVGASGTTKNLLTTNYFIVRNYRLGVTTVGDLDLEHNVEAIFPLSSWQYDEETTTTSGDSTTASGSHRVKQLYTFYEDDETLVDNLVPEVRELVSPAVETASNGSNATTSRSSYLLKDGRVSFGKSATGIISYTGYDSVTGLPAVRVADADTGRTGSGQVFNGVTIPSGFASTGDELHYVSKFTYDEQARLATTELPSERVISNAYSRLTDQRLVVLQSPRRTVSGGTTTYYGPASYGVSNQAGRPEFSGVIALTNNSTTTAMTSWISTSQSDPISALTSSSLGTGGSLVRMSAVQYDSPGTRVNLSRVYHLIPSSGVGSSGTNYDQTSYFYDDMGRRIKTTDPSGTISRTVFDELGRPSASWIGTDDTSFSSTSGGGNMTKVSVTEYDGNADKGNSYVTKRTLDPDGDWTGTTGDQRVTTYTNDVRGRAIATAHPVSPHGLAKYDNLGRVIAYGTYSSTSGLSATSDPTSVSTNRLGLSETLYDARGQVWKSIRHKVSASAGTYSSGDDLISLNWYDPESRLMKSKGESGLSKTRYDRLGRTTHRWTLAKDDDTTYANVWDGTNLQTSVSGDIVLEEDQSVYDNLEGAGNKTGNVMAQVSISRLHSDLANGNTGALDTNADGDLSKFTASDIKGRISIAGMWYDEQDRMTASAQFGTYGATGNASTYDRKSNSTTWASVPSRSDDVLVTSNTFGTDGDVEDVVDPKNLKTKTQRDHAGRTTAVISNYVDGSPSGTNAADDNYVRYVYANGLQTKLWVDIDNSGTENTGDQVTMYTYGPPKGTAAGESKIASGHLLWKETYPDSSGSTDLVTHAYNAVGQEIWRKDQAGNIIETEYDQSGRMTHKRATNIASGFDNAVKRISMAYTNRGQTDTVTQYNHDSTSSGTATDQVQYAYDDYGNVITFTQDVDSVISGGSGRASFAVSHTYARVDPSGGHNMVRRSATTLPGSGESASLSYSYASASSQLDDVVGRVTTLNVGTGPTPVAQYAYLGADRLVSTRLLVPDAISRLYDDTGAYANLDTFGRVTASTWQPSSSTHEFFHVNLKYDRNSNITLQEDTVHIDPSATGDPQRYSAAYTMDGLNASCVPMKATGAAPRSATPSATSSGLSARPATGWRTRSISTAPAALTSTRTAPSTPSTN